MSEEYIDTYRAAEELGISRATLWRLITARGLTRYRAPGNRRVLLRRRDIEALREPVPITKREPRGKAAA